MISQTIVKSVLSAVAFLAELARYSKSLSPIANC